jgi:hypothetical protein
MVQVQEVIVVAAEGADPRQACVHVVVFAAPALEALVEARGLAERVVGDRCRCGLLTAGSCASTT